MLRFLPTGFIGLMVAGLIAANSSTILTTNWASYRARLLPPVHPAGCRRASPCERRRAVTVGLCSAAVVYLMTRRRTRSTILQVGAGTGLLSHPLVLVAGQRPVRDVARW
jgi:hypothetical protein